jgi:hypothetical protein
MPQGGKASISGAVGDGMTWGLDNRPLELRYVAGYVAYRIFHLTYVKYICISRQVYEVTNVSYLDKPDVKYIDILDRGVMN